ncbi:MAG: tryptophan synthase subunit alpha [Thermoleophilia bacterium]
MTVPPTPPLTPRLAHAFAAPRAEHAALIPYVTGGHPDVHTSSLLIGALISGGADIVELGVPFSDPIADGPVVQRSTHEALNHGVTLDDVLRLAATHGARVPFVLLTYLNPVLAYGPERFFSNAAQSGVEAVVIPDLPLDEAESMSSVLAPTAQGGEGRKTDASGGLASIAAAHGIGIVPMATPTSTDERLDMVAAAATSFIYCVAVTGVTGARREVGADLPGLIARLRARTTAPIAVGFGISTPKQAAQVAELADGVIIGSALIDLISRSASPEAACTAAERLMREAGAAIRES